MKGKVFEVDDVVEIGLKKIYSAIKPPPGSRPPCPRCGSVDIISQGRNWYCKRCCRRFIKIKYKTAMIGPLCTECGMVTRSNGIRLWCCPNCGKAAMKKLRRKNDNQRSGIKNPEAGNPVPSCIQPTCPTDADRRCPLWRG
jgi:tRNA(Ile2) C34 agmatinyltransferase TiaS